MGATRGAVTELYTNSRRHEATKKLDVLKKQILIPLGDFLRSVQGFSEVS